MSESLCFLSFNTRYEVVDAVLSNVEGFEPISGPKECVKVHVPRETDLSGDASKFILRLRLDFDADTDYKVDAATEVHFRRPSPILLVQTDKAWYTPGQLVRFRALSLDHLLRPLVKPVGVRFQLLLLEKRIENTEMILQLRFLSCVCHY